MTSTTKTEKLKLGKAYKFYRLAKDPKGCHKTYVDHVIARLAREIEN